VPGGAPEPRPGSLGRFVVQQHSARRLHYDFRLELGGVLKSWAVPRGPSADPSEKRLAVEVEDHPVEYADFEGVIPAGNYGAGPVIVWDRGAWEPVEDPVKGLAQGKLVFRLRGYKLRGEWTLVRTHGKSRGPREWLLIKHKDGFVDPGEERPFAQTSVLSGLAVGEVGKIAERAAALEEAAAAAPRRRVDPGAWKPMLAETRERPFSAPDWLFELKIDGYRTLAVRDGSSVALRSRNGEDVTGRYPEIALAVRALPCERALLDGEIAVLDAEGRPSFQALQGRAQLSRPKDVAPAALAAPASYFAFDLLSLGERDLRPLPLTQRKALLARLAPRLGPILLLEGIEARGEDLWREVKARGLEGIVGKKAGSPYRSGRSGDWVKIRQWRNGDFAVVGYSAPGGKGRVGLGALHLAVRVDGQLRYAGAVGSGFTDRLLGDLRRRLEASKVGKPPFQGERPAGRGHTWVEPSLVCEVTFHDWTGDAHLRQPVFVRLREDKGIEDLTSEGRPAAQAPPGDRSPLPGGERARVKGGSQAKRRAKAGAPPPAKEGDQPPAVPLSNLDKVYFPEDGFTKGDLVDYYRAIAPWLLPHLASRPLTLTRFPDGIHGKSFFQKDAPAWRPGWIRTATVWSEERELAQFVVDDLPSLLYVVNMGTIPIHIGASRAPELGRADWCSVDLDPKGAPFAHVVKLAGMLRALCDDIGLPVFVKTTGQAGLHVLVPLGGQCTHEQARQLAGLLARAVAEAAPDIATMERMIAARAGRVYLDTLQNGLGKTLAAPFCVRPRRGAPVSTPLRWEEVGGKLDPSRFTIETVPRRMAVLGSDPLEGVLRLRPDLVGALARLRDRLPQG
jgi:bifunctional non-homologous end joining protein LigD